MKYIIIVALLVGSLLETNPLLGQDNRPTQKDIDIQQLYIEANKEKLIGNTDEAITLFKEVMSKDKGNHGAAYELAKLYQEQGDKEKSIASAKQAAELDPNNEWYQLLYADLLREDNQFDKAATAYHELVKKHPRTDRYYYEWAYMLIRDNKPFEAVKAYDELEKIKGIDEGTSKRKYTIYMANNKPSKAEEEIKKLVQAFPREVSYRHTLAELYDNTGDKKKSQEVYKEILEIDPEDAIANIVMAEAFKKGGEELKYLNSVTELFKNPSINIDIKVKELFPYIKKASETKDDALKAKILELGKTLTEVHPEEAKAFSIYADLLYYTGDTETALTQYKKTADLDDGVFTVWEQILYILAELEKTEELIETSEEVMDIYPNQATVYYMNGVGNSMKNNHDDAVSSFDQALMMVGNDQALKFKIHVEMARSFFQLKEYDKSDKNFEVALGMSPRDYIVLNSYSYYLAQRGEKLERAKEMAKLANDLAPDRPSFLDTYGWVLYKMGDFEGAKKLIERALEKGGKTSADILEHYGDVLYQLNDVNGAVQYWQQAAQNGGTSDLLKKKIADKKLYE